MMVLLYIRMLKFPIGIYSFKCARLVLVFEYIFKRNTRWMRCFRYMCSRINIFVHVVPCESLTLNRKLNFSRLNVKAEISFLSEQKFSGSLEFVVESALCKISLSMHSIANTKNFLIFSSNLHHTVYRVYRVEKKAEIEKFNPLSSC